MNGQPTANNRNNYNKYVGTLRMDVYSSVHGAIIQERGIKRISRTNIYVRARF